MSKRAIRIYDELLATVPDLFVSLTDLAELKSTGYETEELSYLGIGKQEWKILERSGKALRARLPTRRGHRIRWLLVRQS